MVVVVATIHMPVSTIFQFAASVDIIWAVVGCSVREANASVSVKDLRNQKINGMMAQPTKMEFAMPSRPLVPW